MANGNQDVLVDDIPDDPVIRQGRAPRATLSTLGSSRWLAPLCRSS